MKRAVKRFAIGAVALVFAACSRGNVYAPPPPPEVAVSQAVEKEVTTYREFSGRTAAVDAVDVRARVQGTLQSMHFTPGNDVRKADLLFVIEPELYQARVAQAEADLAGKEAQYRAAQAQLEITEAIFKRSAGSRTDLVQKTQQRDLAKAAVEMARATLEAAKLDLSYTHIYAPISGRISRNLVDPGNLVGANEATLLASIVSDDPIYAYFTAAELDLLRYRELQRENRTVAPAGEHNIAYLGLATEEGFPHLGKVDYVSNRIDPSTGTIEVRAAFPNPDRVILPGLFARVRLPYTREKALLVPEVAVSADQGGSFVLVVDEQNTVQYRRIRLGESLAGNVAIVREGLTSGDWLVVKGLQRARPGTVVKPTRTDLSVPEPQAPTAPDVGSSGVAG
jgi:RND family efflux transporter MFP subunit